MRRDAFGHTRLLRIDVHGRPSGHPWHPQVRKADADLRHPLRRALAAGRRVAIVAVENSSIDLIFRSRRIDYFTETYDEEVVERTLNLVAADQHDFILAYQQEYDDKMHATVPRSPEALRAMANHVRDFDRVARAARDRWATTSYAVAFVSDHGTHIDPSTGRGTHGSNMADDLEVRLFWGVHFPV